MMVLDQGIVVPKGVTDCPVNGGKKVKEVLGVVERLQPRMEVVRAGWLYAQRGEHSRLKPLQQ